MLKKFLLVTLSIIILIGISGCVTRSATRTYSNEEKKAMVLSHLKEKYGEEFEGIAYEPWGERDVFYVRLKNGTDEDWFMVSGGPNKYTGVYEMTDGYFGIYISDKYEKTMSGFIDPFFSNYKIYIKTNVGSNLPQRLNKSTKISEIYRRGEKYGFSADTYVCVKQSVAKGIDINDAAKKIALKMVENKLVGRIDINVVYDERYDLIKLDRKNWKNVSDKENLVKDAVLNVNWHFEIKDYRSM